MDEVEISGAYFSKKHFKETWTPRQLAVIWCKLNSWKTPEEFQLSRELTEEEIKKIFGVLRPLVPKADWLPEWRRRTSRNYSETS